MYSVRDEKQVGDYLNGETVAGKEENGGHTYGMSSDRWREKDQTAGWRDKHMEVRINIAQTGR